MLYIVSTPIGNLKDITLRALETLREVDEIICEDKRVTSILLNHYNISKPLLALNAFNERKIIPAIIQKLLNEKSIALVSDAGTPTISDPGARLINEAIKYKIKISSIPGASAFVAALSISGLPTDSILFEGFLPQKKGRQKKLLSLLNEERTVILYESPYRIEKLMNEICGYESERFIVVCRELTKMFEERIDGTAKELLDHFRVKKPKGEFVVLIAPKSWKVQSFAIEAD